MVPLRGLDPPAPRRRGGLTAGARAGPGPEGSGWQWRRVRPAKGLERRNRVRLRCLVRVLLGSTFIHGSGRTLCNVSDGRAKGCTSSAFACRPVAGSHVRPAAHQASLPARQQPGAGRARELGPHGRRTTRRAPGCAPTEGRTLPGGCLRLPFQGQRPHAPHRHLLLSPTASLFCMTGGARDMELGHVVARSRAAATGFCLAPEVVVQEAHLQVQRVRRTAVQRPAQVGHDLAARHLVAVAHQHHVPPARVLVQNVLRRMQPLVRLAPPARPARRLLPASEGAPCAPRRVRRRCACNRAWRRVGRAPRWAAHGLRVARQEQHRTEHHAAHRPTRAALSCTGLHSALRRGGAVAGARHAVASDTQGLLPLRLRNSGSGSGNLSMTRNVTCGKRESANYFLHPSPGCSVTRQLSSRICTDLHARTCTAGPQQTLNNTTVWCRAVLVQR